MSGGDPAPSRLAYRVNRIRLSPGFRSLVWIAPPLAALGLAASWLAADPARMERMNARIAAVERWVAEQPAFRIAGLEITGASPVTAAAIRNVVPAEFPTSSFDLDLEAMRARVATVDAVARAALHIRSGRLVVAVTERVPAVVWRTRRGLALLDASGHRVTGIAGREDRADLPLVAGAGAKERIDEALVLFERAKPIGDRVRGLVRVGERRWDVVLDRGQRILLPEDAPVPALERVVALDSRRDLLARDVAAVDMRLRDRPTLRLEPGAAEGRQRAGQGLASGTNG